MHIQTQGQLGGTQIHRCARLIRTVARRPTEETGQHDIQGGTKGQVRGATLHFHSLNYGAQGPYSSKNEKSLQEPNI